MKVNVDDFLKLGQRFNAMPIPTLMVPRHGQVAAQRPARSRPRAYAPGSRKSSGTSRTGEVPAPAPAGSCDHVAGYRRKAMESIETIAWHEITDHCGLHDWCAAQLARLGFPGPWPKPSPTT